MTTSNPIRSCYICNKPIDRTKQFSAIALTDYNLKPKSCLELHTDCFHSMSGKLTFEPKGAKCCFCNTRNLVESLILLRHDRIWSFHYRCFLENVNETICEDLKAEYCKNPNGYSKY